MTRVTIDIDSYEQGWQLTAIRAANALRRQCERTEIRVSSSGKGIHIVGWFEETLSWDEKHRIRAHLGDDSNRLHLDEQRHQVGHTTQVLWTNKGNGEVDTSFDDIHAALNHVRRAGFGEWGYVGV